MKYNMVILSTDSVKTYYTCGSKEVEILLEVGNLYKIIHEKPSNKKDRQNNGRIVEVLGFTDVFMGDVIVKYKDNNKRGRVRVSCLLPYLEE